MVKLTNIEAIFAGLENTYGKRFPKGELKGNLSYYWEVKSNPYSQILHMQHIWCLLLKFF